MKRLIILLMSLLVMQTVLAITPIAQIQQNTNDFIDTEVEIEGIITVGVNTINTNYLSVYVQDNSNFGIMLYAQDITNEHLQLTRGTEVNITGTVDEYNGTTEIVDFNFSVIAENQDVPVAELNYAQLQNYEVYEGTYTYFSGLIDSSPQYAGGGTNVIISNEDNQDLTVRIWDVTGIDTDSYASGDSLFAFGVIDFYNDNTNLVPAEEEDIFWTDNDNGDDPPGYYGSAEGLYEQDLFDELHDIIDNHNSLGYDGAKEEMFGYIDNENGQVMGVYTGEYYSIPQGEMPNQNQFNCEHSWPQSWFGSDSSTQKADLHHLFPTFMTVNSSRGNLPFDNVVSINDYYGSGDYVSYRGENENGVVVWEPADQHKGDVARAMLYFAVRYDLDVNDEVQANGYYNVDMMSAFLDWVEEDPVSQKEIDRNEAIFALQNNRNPFVDHPEFIDYIWNGVGNNENETITIHNNLTIFPNPFNPQTTISFNLNQASDVSINIYNLKGQIIREMNRDNLSAGKNSINWNGTDNRANNVASGMYFFQVITDYNQMTNKAILLK